MRSQWTEAIRLTELPEGTTRLFKEGGHRLALIRVDGEVFALDDRCPHEGYPLTQGDLCGTTLTCCFHNFKFDVRDGQCLLGDEAVRAYPTRLSDGVVEVDLAPPDPAAERPRLWASLDRALREWKVGQLARDAVRLLASGVPPEALALRAARHDAVFGEYGTSHALPVAADALRWLDRYPGVSAAHPLVQALEIAAEFHVRRPARDVVGALDPGAPANFVERLSKAVEAEDHGAEGLVRGAVRAGWGRDRLEPALIRVCADHFLDYGHALIYAIKAVDLLDATGWEGAEEILGSLTHRIVVGTREDVLPAWSGFRRRQQARAARVGGWHAGTSALAAAEGLEEALLSAGSEGEEAVATALSAGASVRSIADVLVVAAARRVLRFDQALERDPTWRDTWLAASHVQTFASAVRQAVARNPGPDAVRLLFQGARFVAMTAALDAPEPGWRTEPALVAELEALRVDPRAVRDRWMDAAIADGATRAITVAHAMKQVVAGFDDFEATGRPECALAAIRFVAGDKQERRVARWTREAIALVTEGKIPRKRVP